MTNESGNVKRGRSPNYPAISLKEAVAGIEKLFTKIHQHPAPRETIATSLGYSGLHGASLGAISALLKYGVIERLGDELKLTERAMQILAPHSEREKREALKAAANSPALFGEMLDHFKGDVPPSDELIRSYLIRRGFVPSAVPQVIAAFRETLDLVSTDTRGYYTSTSAEVSEMDAAQQSNIAQQGSSGLTAELGKFSPPAKIERLIDDSGSEITLHFQHEPSVEAYQYLRDYLDFKLKRIERKGTPPKNDPESKE